MARIWSTRRRAGIRPKRTEYAFADLRRRLAQELGGEGFGSDCGGANKPTRNPLIAAVMRLVA
jgi:hypothetical protein